MIAFLRLGHCQRKSLPVDEINGIGGFASLPSLIFDAFSSSDSRRVRSVNMRQGQIQKRTVFPDQPGKHHLPIPEFTPFPVMVEYSLVTGRLSGEEMTYQRMFPLTSGLELIKDSRNDRQQIKFTGEASFCYAVGRLCQSCAGSRRATGAHRSPQLQAAGY